MMFSARSLSLARKSSPVNKSATGCCDLPRVPLIGRVWTWPLSTRMNRSGDALATCQSPPSKKPANGAGLRSRNRQ